MSESTIMFVFPGQGSQYAGMGSDLCAEFPSHSVGDLGFGPDGSL